MLTIKSLYSVYLEISIYEFHFIVCSDNKGAWTL